ncbi:hypothetical protein Dip510_001406 [Elusimicrobium posterum]|uniref:hypothetical protein n=1 Tax=Elusimicrobium posterum TaxID=3116653 RepID=UPI003C76E425
MTKKVIKKQIRLSPIAPFLLILGGLFFLISLAGLIGTLKYEFLPGLLISLAAWGVSFYMMRRNDKLNRLFERTDTVKVKAKVKEIYKNNVLPMRGAQLFNAPSTPYNIVAENKGSRFYQYNIYEKILTLNPVTAWML